MLSHSHPVPSEPWPLSTYCSITSSTDLGTRYGWRPAKEDLTAQTFESYGHMINSYIPGRSVTECEVLSGALGWGSHAVCAPANAFFYIRSDHFCDDIPVDARDAFIEPDPRVMKRLVDLKRRIRARAAESEKYHGGAVTGARLPFVECCRDYDEPADFAKMLYEDLLMAIKRDYPQKKIHSSLDERFMMHLQFASQHCPVYVGHELVQEKICQYVASAASAKGPRKPLVVVGATGSGKSAALANWLMNATDVKGFVFPHFCGSTSNSSNHETIMTRLAMELKRCFGLEADLPSDKGELLELVPQLLFLVCSATPVTILIDGIDQLNDPMASQLHWLPTELPRNCSLILSTSKEAPCFGATQQLAWNDVIMLPKLSANDKEEITVRVLEINHKTIEPHMLIMLSKAKQTASPLFLHMVLKELLANAIFETLHSLLAMCLEQPGTSDLARLILVRLEAQFGTGLVRSIFCFLEASRFGMSEGELIHALQLNQAEWATFFAGVRGMLCESAGLFNFANHGMQVAVRSRYFTDEAATRKIHRELIDLFTTAPSEHIPVARRCMELPYQMMRANELSRLSDFLVSIGNVRYVLTDTSLARDLTDFWMQSNQGKALEELGPKYIYSLQRYEPVLREEVAAQCEGGHDDIENAYLDLLSTICAQIGTFLCTLFQYKGAAILHERALEIDHARLDNMSERVAQDTRRLANTHYLLGRYEQAVINYELALGIYGELIKAEPWARLEYAQTLFEMANAARYMEDPSHAKVQCLSALRTFQQMLGEKSPRVVAKARTLT